MQAQLPAGVELRGERDGEILTDEALDFVAGLQRAFGGRREELLARRAERQERLLGGELPDFLAETRSVREDASWRVAEAPPDLRDRRVEITGPTDRKMVINALNSGARVFMADFEDANSPTWANIVEGQRNLIDAVERRSRLDTGGKSVQADTTRSRRCSSGRAAGTSTRSTCSSTASRSRASLFDFGLYMFHSARRALERGAGPTSTCRSWRATSRRASGTTSSCTRRTRSASRAARSAPPS